MPKELEKIDVQPADRKDDDGVIWVALYGAADAVTLKRYGDQIQERLAAIPGVSRAKNCGIPYEIGIEVAPEQLRKYQLTQDDIAQAVRKASVDLLGGLIENPNGNRVRLDQIAAIKDGL